MAMEQPIATQQPSAMRKAEKLSEAHGYECLVGNRVFMSVAKGAASKGANGSCSLLRCLHSGMKTWRGTPVAFTEKGAAKSNAGIGRSVEVNGFRFPTYSAAVKVFGGNVAGLSKAISKGQTHWRGHLIKRIDKIPYQQKQKGTSLTVNDKPFISVASAVAFLGFGKAAAEKFRVCVARGGGDFRGYRVEVLT